MCKDHMRSKAHVKNMKKHSAAAVEWIVVFVVFFLFFTWYMHYFVCLNHLWCNVAGIIKCTVIPYQIVYILIIHIENTCSLMVKLA